MNDRPSVLNVPLVVDLDGTLLHTDLLHESTLAVLRDQPLCMLAMLAWLMHGKAHLKQQIARRVDLDLSSMPFNAPLVTWLRAEKTAGRRLVLATASDRRLADAVARHLDLFDEVLASDGTTNNAAHDKAAALVARFGERGFDYAGNSRPDLAVWARAHRAIVVAASPAVRRAAARVAEVEREFSGAPGGWRQWIQAVRLHQWAKNLLLFLPLLGSHQLFDVALLQKAVVAFVAFGCCASSVYLVNDLMDLESDRHHPRKRKRPFAAGMLSPLAGVVVAAVLLGASIAIAIAVNGRFTAALLAYVAMTAAYTFWLKRKEVVDALSLAALYTLRIVAGGLAAEVPSSFWLLAFSLFLFLSLAFVKRHSELQVMLAQSRDEAGGRGYRTSDLPLIEMMGVVSGFAAVLVLALYINGETVVRLYARPEVVWLTVPILLYWVTRVWIKTHRGLMHDDPVLFAMKDRVSLLSGALFVAVLWAAT